MTETKASMLFVDNDKKSLTELCQLLADEQWNCHCFEAPEQALAFMADNPVDLIISNAELPEAAGIDLLRRVREQHPGVIRLFVASTPETEQTIAAISAGYAQQIIPKPWFQQELKEIIRSALRQSAQQRKQSLPFQALINSMPLLPPLPETYSHVRSCIMDDDVDLEKMAAIIGQDVALSSTILHWANSALFGQRFRVDTIKKAIVVLGTDIVASLVLSDAVARSMTTSGQVVEGFDLKQFMHHSIAVAVIARLLVKTTHPTDTDMQDRVFVAGLLHDLGKMVAAKHFGKKFSAAIRLAHEQGWPLHEAERKLHGTTHAELGSFLAEWWALPHFIVAAIELHQEPKDNPLAPQIVNAVYLANLLSYRFGFGCNGEQSERDIDQKLWDKFLLSEEGLEILAVKTTEILTALHS